MYKIYADNILIYDDTSDDFNLKLTAATLSLEDNAAGSLEFTMPITNAGYNSIQRMRTSIRVDRDGDLIWFGRPLSESTDFYKNKTIFCEGALGYLNDTFQPVAEYHDITLYQFLEIILQIHNNKCNGDEIYTDYSTEDEGEGEIESGISGAVNKSTFDFYQSIDSGYNEEEAENEEEEEFVPGTPEASYGWSGYQDKRIFLGSVTVTDSYDTGYRSTSYTSTLETLQSIVDANGGHLMLRGDANGTLYLDYFSDYPNRNSQVIRFGKNLLDYTRNYDLSNLCTVLLPLGAKKDNSDLVGDPVTTHWNRRSILTASGNVRLGKYFHRTVSFPIERQTTYKEYKSSDNTFTEKTFDNVLRLTCEQVTGYVVYAFYDETRNLISATTAGNALTGMQSFTDTTLSIPSGARYVSFGFYYGEKGHMKEFKAEYRTYWKTVTWTRHSKTVGQASAGLTDAIANEIIDATTGAWVQSFSNDYVVSNPIPMKEDEVFFITARQDSGYGMYCPFLANGTPMTSVTTADDGVGFTDWKKHKVEGPTGVSYFLVGAKTGVEMNPVVYGDYKEQNSVYVPPDEYVTVEEVNNDSLYVKKASLIALYGWIEKQMTWEDMTDPQMLLDRAEDYLDNMQYDEMVLEIKALDFNLVTSGEEAINLCDKVQCISEPHGLNKTMPVTKIEIPILEPQNATFTLGESRTVGSLTGSTVDNELAIFSKIDEIPTPSSILKSAKANATSLINQKTNGYVQIDANEILIMDAPDKMSATRLWRMNVNGIGYSNEGYAGTYGLAFTMDGAIVADRITTGYLHADRIRGGTLTLGGYDNVNGEFYMKNAEGRTFLKMTKDGTEMMAKLQQVMAWDQSSEGIGTGSSASPQYGVIEIQNGCINGYGVKIRAELTENEATTPDWWKTYSFAFDDVSEYHQYTKVSLLRQQSDISRLATSYGIDIQSAKHFSLWLTAAIDNYVKYAPHLELGYYGNTPDSTSSGALVFGKGGSSFVGLFYDGNDPGYDFTSGSGRTDFFDDSSVHYRTLMIRNDAYPNTSYTVLNDDNCFGYGGVYLLSKGAPIDIDGKGIKIRSNNGQHIHARGNRIFIKADDDFSVTMGNYCLTQYSGAIPVVTRIQSNGDGTITWDYSTIDVKNGFVIDPPAGSTSSSGSYSWPGFNGNGSSGGRTQVPVNGYHSDGGDIPTSIRITTPPTKLNYTDGETIDYTGMVVTLYDSNGDVFTNDRYTTGVIPANELILPVSTASVSDASGGGMTSELNTGLSHPVNYTTQSFTTVRLYDNGDKLEVVNTGNGSSNIIIFGVRNGNSIKWHWLSKTSFIVNRTKTNIYWNGTTSISSDYIYSSLVTHRGDTFYKCTFDSSNANQFIYYDAPVQEDGTANNDDLWLILYGNTNRVQTVTVNWNNPYTNSELTDSFEIQVTEAA